MTDTEPFEPWPHFEADEIEAVADVLRSGKVNYWTGPECGAFEREFARRLRFRTCCCPRQWHTRARPSTPCARHRPLVTRWSSRPDRFLASASCVVNAAAKPIFADVDPDSQNITAETIEPVLSERTRAVICVHLAGWPTDMDPITELCQARGVRIVEDVAQAHGARYRGRFAGALGDISAFSFCQDKIMTTGGEGGMLMTDDPDLWKKAWSFKDHGKSYDAVFNREHPPGFRWLHESFGTNWRLTGMQAAIGQCQLKKTPALAGAKATACALFQRCFWGPIGASFDPPIGGYRARLLQILLLRASGALEVRLGSGSHSCSCSEKGRSLLQRHLPRALSGARFREERSSSRAAPAGREGTWRNKLDADGSSNLE